METKYDKIGTNYNLTRKADKLLTENLFRLLDPKTGGIYLDIGCGTGNYTNELQKKGLNLIGIDPSEKMLEVARLKNDHTDWRVGSAEATNLPNESIDGIVGSLTMHHWDSLPMAFGELYRVLKPNGNIVVFTSTPKQMRGYWLNHYFPKMLADSIHQMPTLESVEQAMTQSGFQINGYEAYHIQPDLEDKFLYCGKHDPGLYFDEQIRHGISSFSSLANRTEVEKGLIALKEDIDTREIQKIMKSYENDFGDYLYIFGRK